MQRWWVSLIRSIELSGRVGTGYHGVYIFVFWRNYGNLMLTTSPDVVVVVFFSNSYEILVYIFLLPRAVLARVLKGFFSLPVN